MHFRFSFEPRFSEVDKSLFLAPPLRATSCNVHYSGPILYDNESHERETWSKSKSSVKVGFAIDVTRGSPFSPLVSFTLQRASRTRVHLKTSNNLRLVKCVRCIEKTLSKMLLLHHRVVIKSGPDWLI